MNRTRRWCPSSKLPPWRREQQQFSDAAHLPDLYFFKYEKSADLKVTLPLLQEQWSSWVTCADRALDDQIRWAVFTQRKHCCSTVCRVPDLCRRQHLYIQRIHRSRGICQSHTRPKRHRWTPSSPPWPFQHIFASADKLDTLQTSFSPTVHQIWIKVTHLALGLNVRYSAFLILMAMNEVGLSLLVWQ